MKITEEAHHIGFKTTATMMFGHAESDYDIIEHLPPKNIGEISATKIRKKLFG